MKYIKHPEFSIIERIILDLLSNISLSHPKRLQKFLNELNSERNNPIKYYKALIKFAQE